MKVSDYIAQFLAKQGITHVFELTGGMIVQLLDSIHQQGKIKIISVHHEQAAAFAADVAGRLTGKPGVAFGTSGPGATNLLTGIGSCYFDSSPAIFITGQVNRHEMKGDRNVRQTGFQEMDIISIAKPLTKAAWQVKNAEEIPELLERAFHLAMEGRPGPILIDIPMDIQREDIESNIEIISKQHPHIELELDDFAQQLIAAKRPIAIVGGGIRAGDALDELRTFVNKFDVPVIFSLMAVDVMPYSHPLRVGLIGTYGNRWANMAIMKSDFIVVLGSRLDIRQTGADTVGFKQDRIIYHVDCEDGEINNRVKGCHAILSDLKVFLSQAIQLQIETSFDDWKQEINNLREQWPDVNEQTDITGINPNEFFHQLSQYSSEAAAYTVDVGLHQMWAAQSIEVTEKQRFLTSGGMGSMGFALPAGIGASLITGQPVVVIAGDGGMQINIQEFQTLVRNKLPIKIIIINNQSLGMLRQFQQSYFDSRFQSSVWGYDTPDFVKVAEAYGIAGKTIQNPEDVPEALQWLWQDASQPALLQVMVDVNANAYPKIAFGRPIDEMEPQFQPMSMGEGT